MSENLFRESSLTLHFRMQQLTCGAHWRVAGAMGPREALSEQYSAPCLLLCQPPETRKKGNHYNLYTGGRGLIKVDIVTTTSIAEI